MQVAATTITLASSLNPAALGAGVVFTATVKTTNAVTIPTATGSVIFRDGLTALFTSSAITAGVVKYTNSALAYGPHSITAEYSGNSNCLAGTNSPALNQIISIPTTITLVSSSNPSIYLGNAQFTATVLAGGVTATNAGGTMILKRSGTSLVTNTVTSGVATYNLTSLAPGTNLMTATYVGDPVYLTSSSGTLTQTVQIAVTVVLQSLINPGVEGTPGSYQIDLQTNGVNVGGTLSGSITLKDGANVLGIPVPVTSSTSYGSDYGSLAAGWHYLTAEYSGDGDLFVASTNLVPVAQAISSSSQTPTTLTLGSSPNPSTTGNRVTFTATVSAADATGTVVFKDAGVMLGSGGVTNGAATYGTSALAGGVHAITAEYSGNTTYGPSPAGLSQTNRIQTTMVLASSANPSINGSSFTLTATVQTNGATAGAATGTVVFKDGGTALNTNAVGGGVATYSTSALALGSHSLTAEYSGSSDSLYLASTNSPALTQVVKWATTTAVASSLNPSTNGNTVIFTATIKTNNATATAATGTMTFKSGGSALGSPGVTNGVATFQTSGLPTGTSSITAEYSGDSAYLASVSSALPQVVQSAGPTTLPTVSYSVNGTTLTLSWPADYLGWTLQGQTNAAGIGAGWGDIPGTALVTSTNLPVMPANPAVFYRLRHSNP